MIDFHKFPIAKKKFTIFFFFNLNKNVIKVKFSIEKKNKIKIVLNNTHSLNYHSRLIGLQMNFSLSLSLSSSSSELTNKMIRIKSNYESLVINFRRVNTMKKHVRSFWHWHMARTQSIWFYHPVETDEQIPWMI